MTSLEEKLKKYGKEPLNLTAHDYIEIISHLQFIIDGFRKDVKKTIDDNPLLNLINQAFPMR